MCKQGGLSQHQIILRYLSWLDNWIFEYELVRINTQYGFISHNGDRRVRELHDKGLVDRRIVDGKAQYRYLKEPLKSNLSENKTPNTQTTMKDINQAVTPEYCQPVEDKRPLCERFADTVKNIKFNFGNNTHIEAYKLIKKLSRLKKPKDIENCQKEILFILNKQQ